MAEKVSEVEGSPPEIIREQKGQGHVSDADSMIWPTHGTLAVGDLLELFQ